MHERLRLRRLRWIRRFFQRGTMNEREVAALARYFNKRDIIQCSTKITDSIKPS